MFPLSSCKQLIIYSHESESVRIEDGYTYGAFVGEMMVSLSRKKTFLLACSEVRDLFSLPRCERERSRRGRRVTDILDSLLARALGEAEGPDLRLRVPKFFLLICRSNSAPTNQEWVGDLGARARQWSLVDQIRADRAR
jgi:hypothetical protein